MKTMLIYLGVLILLVLLTMFLPDARAKDFDFDVKGVYSIYRDKDLVKDGQGVKGEFKYKYFYLWGSFEQTEFRLTGQRAGDIELFGMGLGGKVTLLKPVSLFAEVGYYIPNTDLKKDISAFSEGIYYKWYRALNEVGLPNYASRFTSYKYDLKSGFGGSVGLELDQKIYKRLSINGFASYRFLNLRENWDAYDPLDSRVYIQTKEKRDFSGAVFGLGLSYKF